MTGSFLTLAFGLTFLGLKKLSPHLGAASQAIGVDVEPLVSLLDHVASHEVGVRAHPTIEWLHKSLRDSVQTIDPPANEDLERAIDRSVAEATYFCLSDYLGSTASAGVLTSARRQWAEAARKRSKARLEEVDTARGGSHSALTTRELLETLHHAATVDHVEVAIGLIETSGGGDSGSMPDEIRAVFRRSWLVYVANAFRHKLKHDTVIYRVCTALTLGRIEEKVDDSLIHQVKMQGTLEELVRLIGEVLSARHRPPDDKSLEDDVKAESQARASAQPGASSRALRDPAAVFVPLRCQTRRNGQVAARDALAYLKDGIGRRTSQLLLANYGMGKSYLAEKLYSDMLAGFLREPSSGFVPVLVRLRGETVRSNEPDDVLRIIRNSLVTPALIGRLPALLAAGRLCVIFDGIDEMALVHTEDDPRRLAEILEQFNLERYGPCPCLATSRTGRFAAALEGVQASDKYGTVYLTSWGPDEWHSYLTLCLAQGEFDSAETRDRLRNAVDRSPQLRELTATPLLAWMLVKSKDAILDEGKTFNRSSLYEHFTDEVLQSRETLRDLELRRQCLEAAAASFFRDARNECLLSELVNIADAYVDSVSRRHLQALVMIELQTYSLLALDSETRRFSFSHKSFYEYFLARAVLRGIERSDWVSSELLKHRWLDSGEAEFLAMAVGNDAALVARLRALLQSDTTRQAQQLRRNLVHVALELARRAENDGASRDLLAHANLLGIDLSNLDCSGIRFDDTDLTNATLVGTDLTDASLLNAVLLNANLARACLDGADCQGARFQFATLTGLTHPVASSRHPRLKGADFFGVFLFPGDADYLDYVIRSDRSAPPEWRAQARTQIAEGAVGVEESPRVDRGFSGEADRDL